MPTPPDFAAASSGLRLVPDAECATGQGQLSLGALRALRQLERRLRTGALDAVNIRDVQELTALGFAHHGRSGWRPTREGLNYLGERQDQGGGETVTA